MASIIKCKKKKTDGRYLQTRDYLLLKLYQKATQLVDEFMDSPELRKSLIRIKTDIENVITEAGIIFWYSHEDYESDDSDEWISICPVDNILVI